VLYSFKAIPPKMHVSIKIPNRAINISEFVEDFDAKNLTKFDNLKFKKMTNLKCVSMLIEFAYYKNITLLSNGESYYLDEFNFNKHAQSYNVLTISIKR